MGNIYCYFSTLMQVGQLSCLKSPGTRRMTLSPTQTPSTAPVSGLSSQTSLPVSSSLTATPPDTPPSVTTTPPSSQP